MYLFLLAAFLGEKKKMVSRIDVSWRTFFFESKKVSIKKTGVYVCTYI